MLHAVRSAGGARPALPPHVGVAGDWAASRRSPTPSGGCFNYRHRCTKPPHSRQHGGSAGRAGTSPIDPAARPSMLGKTGSCIAAARFDNMPPAASAAASLAALTLPCAAPVAKPASPRSPAAAASHGAAVQTDRSSVFITVYRTFWASGRFVLCCALTSGTAAACFEC